jgi:hypothetical protein
MIGPIFDWLGGNGEILGQAAGVFSAFVAASALVFNAFQFRDQRKSIDLRTSFELCAEVEKRFDIFCDKRIAALANGTTSDALDKRALINLMSLFEQIAFATREGLLAGRSRRLLVDQVSDILDKLVADDYARDVIKSSKDKPDIYSETKRFVMKRRRRLRNFEFVRLSFGLRKLTCIETLFDNFVKLFTRPTS